MHYQPQEMYMNTTGFMHQQQPPTHHGAPPPPPSLFSSRDFASNGNYLNLPPLNGHADSVANTGFPTGNTQTSSPLPPPPPLPNYGHHQQPTPTGTAHPQPIHPSQFLDLSMNREIRGSAFEVYRKPHHLHQQQQHHHMEQHGSLATESQMFQNLPPPPPPLSVNDYK